MSNIHITKISEQQINYYIFKFYDYRLLSEIKKKDKILNGKFLHQRFSRISFLLIILNYFIFMTEETIFLDSWVEWWYACEIE